MGRPRVHDERTAELLLDEAETLLARDGPDGVSVRAVAEASGTTTRAVYTLFGGKEGLVRGLCQRGYRELVARLDGLPRTDDPGADLVAAGVDGFRAFAVARPHLFRLTFERVTPDLLADPDVAAAAFDAYQQLARLIERLPQTGRVGNMSVPIVVFQFHSLCQGLATSELQSMAPPVGSGFWYMVDPGELAPAWETAVNTFVRGLTGDT